jgi:hypothetical protein
VRESERGKKTTIPPTINKLAAAGAMMMMNNKPALSGVHHHHNDHSKTRLTFDNVSFVVRASGRKQKTILSNVGAQITEGRT